MENKKVYYGKKRSSAKCVDTIPMCQSLAQWVSENGKIDKRYEFVIINKAIGEVQQQLDTWRRSNSNDLSEKQREKVIEDYTEELESLQELKAEGCTHVLMNNTKDRLYEWEDSFTAEDTTVRVGDYEYYTDK